MKSIRTEHVIDASPERVFAVLANFGGWNTWNTVIPKIRGEARVGSPVKFRIVIPGLPPLSLAAKVTSVEPNRRLAWTGGVRGVLVGEHYFELSPLGDGKTRLVHGEDFTGALSRLLIDRVVAKIDAAYDSANRALAAEARRS